MKWRLPIWLEGSSFQQALIARLPPPSKLFEAITGDTRAARFARHTRLHAGHWWRCEWFTHHFLLEHSIGASIKIILNASGFLCFPLNCANMREVSGGQSSRTSVLTSAVRCPKPPGRTAIGFGYWLLGSPYPALLALTGALAWLIPVAGAPLAVILPVLDGTADQCAA